MQSSHTLPEKELIKKLNSKPEGLTSSEAASRLEKFGKNEILEKKPTPLLLTLLKQFHSWLIYILIIAAIISYYFKHLIDVYVILAVILINAAIGFTQERKAERSIRALKKLIVSYAKVYRDNSLTKINAVNLVPGDIVYLKQGDKIPADARLLEIKNFQTNEASLTGESFPVAKEIKSLPEATQVADRKNMVFMGTFVTSGNAKAIIVATGINTEVGKVARDIQKIPHAKSHFQEKSDLLAKQMGAIAIASALITFIIGYSILKLDTKEMLLFTIAILVSAIPEGLPAVLAIVLAIGSFRMSKRNALIRKLSATETLGIVTTILTDKTGTLTENTMNVESIILSGNREIKVTGDGWKPKGNFIQDKKTISPLENKHLTKLLNISAVCNNSKILKAKNTSKKNNPEKYTIIGDPTEAALLVLAEKTSLKKDTLIKNRLDDLPFNQDLKFRASLYKNQNQKELYVVGAPEAILKNSKKLIHKNKITELNTLKLNNLNKQISTLTKNGQRVLAIAYKPLPNNISNINNNLVNDLILVGVVGIRDPPRAEVKDSIAKAKNAGIRIVMATGDHKETALAIAMDTGLVEKTVKVYTENDLKKLNKKQFSDTIRNQTVFARLTPNMKFRIAEELQKQGEIVAMTGDGVNDAPALKKADIGISMGIIGTDVARESSDIVLADDNFASIVNAVEEGRIVFNNTRQASSFLITTNVAEVITLLSTMLAGFPLALIPIQILWLNLVTDGLNDVALATEQGHGDTLNKKPRNSKENFLSKDIIPFLLIMSVIMAIATFLVFQFFLTDSIEKARTGAFTVMAFTQLFNVFNMRSLKLSAFKIGFFSNKYINMSVITSIILLAGVIYLPFFQNIFQFATLTAIELLVIIVISSLVLVAGELYKRVRK
jgi:Ca2+-transporting ATPase